MLLKKFVLLARFRFGPADHDGHARYQQKIVRTAFVFRHASLESPPVFWCSAP